MKKYLLGLFAVVLAIGFSAFTKPKKNLTLEWFTFTGTSTSQYSNSAYYVRDANQVPDCDGSATLRCAIQAVNDGNGEPDFMYATGTETKRE